MLLSIVKEMKKVWNAYKDELVELVIKRVKLESTERALFSKGADIFNHFVYEFSSSLFISFYMHILRFLI